MENTCVEIKGKKYWISRSMCTVGFVYAFDFNTKELCILAVRRGPGQSSQADDPGKWCCPCGYLDYDETLEECCRREIFEETGVMVQKGSLQLMKINSDPSQPHQNVAFRYRTTLTCVVPTNTSHSENNEVLECKWIPISRVDDYEWAFGHGELIKEYR